MSERTGRSFIDVDAMIQELDAAEGKMRRPVRDIYAEDGSARFMQLEATACEMLSQRTDGTIVSTGGGLCDNTAAVRAIESGVIIHLSDDIDLVLERTLRNGIPAFVMAKDADGAREELQSIYARREGLYREMAHHTVEISRAKPSVVAEHVVTVCKELADGR